MSRGPVDCQEVARLTRAGVTAPKIAERLGCTTRTVQRARARLGISQPVSPTAGRPISAERLERVRRMVEDGASHAEITRTLGVNQETLRRHFPGTQWSPQQSSEMAAAVRRANKQMRRAA